MPTARTLQKDDLFQLQFLNGGRLSPDASQVIYCLKQIDAAKERELSAIHLLDLPSGAVRSMTSGTARDSSPQFAPDGSAIAFVSDRSGEPQLYRLPIDGGEAQQLTEFKYGVGGFAWSPDGSRIAFTAKPQTDEQQPDLSKQPYRLDRTVYRFDAIGYLDQQVHNVFVLELAEGETRQLTDDRCHSSNPRWSPDGTQILCDAAMQPHSAHSLMSALTLIDAASGKQHHPLPANWGFATRASFTPDGQRIVFIGRPLDGKPIGTKSDLYVLHLASGQLENRSAGLAVGVGGRLSLDMPVSGLSSWNVLVADDGAAAYATVQSGGTNHICRIALQGAENYAPLTAGECAVSPLDLQGQRLLYAQTTLNSPPDLHITDLPAGTSRQLSRLNADFLEPIHLPETVRLLWESVDGVQVEGWYMKPPGGTAPYPTILYIHGGPHAAYGCGFHFDFQMLAGAGYGVLFINHRASTGYGDGFSTAIKGDWGNLDYQDLMSGVDYAIASGLADAQRLGVCGTSGGGNLSCWIVGQTDRFKAAIPQNPVTNWRSFYGTSDIGIYFAVEQMGGHPHEIPETYEKCSPITYAHRCKTPTLLVQSELDWRCPAEQSEQFYAVLKANGCIVEMLRQPGGSHGASISGAVNLRQAHNEAMLEWFARYVLNPSN